MFYKDLIIIADNDWNTFWYQTQQFACGFASHGSRVFYLNRTLQRLPKIRDIKERFFNKSSRLINKNMIKKNVYVITPLLLPPFKILRPINRILIRRVLSSFNITSPLLITYIPTYNAIDIINIVKPSKVVYVNVHHYNSAKVIKDVIKAEKELIKKCNVLFADSYYNKNRLSKLSNNRKIYLSPPGVHYKLFHSSFRGDESIRCKTLYYFGGIGPHIDLSLYNNLGEIFEVIFIGIVDPKIRYEISSKIKIIPPVENLKLPKNLWDSDILTIFYKNTPYIQGVIPAKFFECLATNKPVLVSGLEEVKPYLDVVYDVEGSVKKVLNIIKKLPETEINTLITKKNKIAIEADWSKRFEAFIKNIN